MAETPVILSHNVLKNAEITGAGRENHPAWFVADGLRWTWWEGVSVAEHYLLAKMHNWIPNGDFEVDDDGWILYESGSGDGAFSRNTTSPIEGNGDGKIEVTTADDGNNKVILISEKTWWLKAGFTYRFSFVAKADAARNFRYGFTDSLVVEESYSDVSLGTNVSERFIDFTPTANGHYRVFVRPLEAGAYYMDDLHLTEVRDCDTLVIDKGHTLRNYQYKVEKANTVYGGANFLSWMNWTFIGGDCAIYNPNGNQSQGFRTGVQWKITVKPFAGLTDIATPQIPLVFIGGKWSLPRNFTGGIRSASTEVLLARN